MPVPGRFRFYDYPGTGLPDTNNTLGGLFSDPKSNRVHSGISKEHRKKLLDGNIKRHYWPAAPSPEYTTSGDYRSSAAGGSTQGPSSRLICCLSITRNVHPWVWALNLSLQMSRWPKNFLMITVSLFARFVTQSFRFSYKFLDFIHNCDTFQPKHVTALFLQRPMCDLFPMGRR